MNQLHYNMTGSASVLDEPGHGCDWLNRLPVQNYPLFSHNGFFNNQACSVKITGYWPRSFLLFVSGLQSKAKLGQYPVILTLPLDDNRYISPSQCYFHPDKFSS